MGGWAFHAEAVLMYPRIAREFEQEVICRLSEVTLIPATHIALMAQKDSPYTDMFRVR